jgi:tape measure domain-containing protein
MPGEKQMADQQVGNIVYVVQMDVQQLLTAQRQVNDRLNRLEGDLGNTTRAVNNTEKSMLSLSRVAMGLASALSVQQVAKYAEAWTVVNNKLSNSIKPHEELGDAVNRVFNLAQSTRTELDATASLYSRLERATRQAGTSTEDLARLTTIINQAFIVSGATAQEAESAIIQLSQGLASGTLRGEEYNSVNEQGNRLIVALSESLGVGAGKLREMAFAGKLTTDVVVKGLLKQGDAIGKEFANTVTTMGQAFSVATNNITKFVGESTTVKSAYNAFNSSVVTISENLEGLSVSVMAVAAVFGSRFVGALAMASAAKVKGALNAQALAKAELQSAQAAQFAANSAVRKAVADKAAAVAALELAERELLVARGSMAEATAIDNLNAKKSIAIAVSTDLIVAENALAAATTRTAAAVRAASATWTLAKNALALVGGPTGAAFLAGAAIYYFYQRSEEAKKSAFELADGVNALISRMREMSDIQLAAEIARSSQAIKVQTSAIEDQRQVVAGITKDIDNQTISMKAYGQTASKLEKVADLTNELAIETEKLDEMERKNSQTKSAVSLLQAKLNGDLRTGIDLLKSDGQEAGVASGLMRKLGDAINFAGRAKEKFNSTSLNVERSAGADKILKQLKEENELLAITDKRQRAITEARQKAVAADAKPNSNQLRQIEEEAGKKYDLTEAEKALKKEARESASASKKATTQAEHNAKVLEEYRQKAELTADSVSELSRAQTVLQAKNKLTNASPDDIAQVEKDAAAAWDKAAALKAQSAVPELKENVNYASQKAQLDMLQGAKDAQGKLLISQDQYNQQSAKLEQDHITALAQIRAGQVVTPQQEAAALVDPVQALANENAKKLALIREFETEKGVITENGLALMNAANTEYEAQRTAAQWQLLSQQSLGYDMLTSAVDAFSGNASNALTGLITGSMSAEEAMRSLGSTMLNSVVNSLVQVGVEALKNFIIAQTIGTAGQAAAAAAATAGGAAALAAWTPAAIAASVATLGTASGTGLAAYQTAQTAGTALSIAGMRKNGGPVSAGSLYQVGEGGLPEIYQASNGSRYMIPGDNGKVISNKDMQGGNGQIQVSIQFYDYSSGQHSFDAQATQNGNYITVEAYLADMNNGGVLSQSHTNNFNVRRVPRGQG